AVPVALAPVLAGVALEVAGIAAGTLRVSIALYAGLAVAEALLRMLCGADCAVARVLRALVRPEVALAAVARLVLGAAHAGRRVDEAGLAAGAAAPIDVADLADAAQAPLAVLAVHVVAALGAGRADGAGEAERELLRADERLITAVVRPLVLRLLVE